MDPQNSEKHSEAYAQPPAYYEQAPPLPPRTASTSSTLQPGGGQPSYPAPPQRLLSARSSTEDISSPVHYTRDPHKLVAYLVPFPKPKLHGIPPEAIPARFLIYTPPPPPLKSPKEGEKEAKVHKLQRKWQEEVRSAKTSTAKTAIGLEEMVLIYPNSIKSSPDQLKIEFVQSMMRSKSKAQRDSVIATGLLPVSAAIDIMATLIWPFGGLLEIDAVWAAASIRGAKISRNVTKRLTSTSTTGKHDEDTLKLSFTPSPRLEVLDKYLGAKCHDKDAKTFPSFGAAPTETDCLQAIGWAPSQTGGDAKNWEDEHWETAEVKEDLKTVMTKAAREWEKWCKAYEKNPEKAVKK
ncbi:hypothetical protein M438DRAFT_271411 [Aureobasidium pullulans EXF-150]|uniref:Secreted protein n=1 Tax=Aureobasidium pullulans EXF-150 TaxID=1043002 RepID=A0A074YFB4_AURPU|nr:uncharacterized protein M438DRAFT_271411 [Aureobasidium pullulans EXF-150]KEQ85531.1 hypothetical protein M438DRAFT_271411 [Aureobasidium pullulans EXF-150]